MATKEIKATPSAYSGISDEEFLKYNTGAEAKWAEVGKKQTYLADLQKRQEAARNMFLSATSPHDATNWQTAYGTLTVMVDQATKALHSLQGEAQILETQRENRGAVLKQGNVNAQARTAGDEAVQAENLLARNIGQELQGRVALNLIQAEEAKKNIGLQQEAATGRSIARAGQAGYDAGSGTALAMSSATQAKYDAERQALEGYRVGRQNLLMQQGDAATAAADTLVGTVQKTTADWDKKSTERLADVTGTLLSSVRQVAGTGDFAGDVGIAGVPDSRRAVDTTLNTWSFESYLDTLNTLTSRSVNKRTWDQMLLEKESGVVNPYDQYSSAISPLTPRAGVQSNLLAAASAADLSNVYTSSLSGTKRKTGSLL